MSFSFITPSATLISERDPYKKVELAARTCYKSEDNITEDSARKMVANLISRKHYAMLEHQVFVFQVPPYGKIEGSDKDAPLSEAGEIGYLNTLSAFLDEVEKNGYLHVTRKTVPGWLVKSKSRILVSGNLRAFNEAGWIAYPFLKAIREKYPDLAYGMEMFDGNRYSDNSYECLFKERFFTDDFAVEMVDFDHLLPEPTEEEILAHKNVTVHLVTDRGVTHEIVRHRPASYGQESTRYVNYRQGISVALPVGYYQRSEEVRKEYESAFKDANAHYGRLIEMGQKPQEARAVLPNALKAEIVMTANMQEWRHVINLRYLGTTGAPHPDMRALMTFVYEILMADPLAAKVLPTLE